MAWAENAAKANEMLMKIRFIYWNINNVLVIVFLNGWQHPRGKSKHRFQKKQAPESQRGSKKKIKSPEMFRI